MQMSEACGAPVHAPIQQDDRKHPRYNQYLRYRSAMSAQLVYCQSFKSWLICVENAGNNP